MNWYVLSLRRPLRRLWRHVIAHQRPPAEEWQAFLELGLQGVTIPEAYDGAPMDDITESIIVEELARVIHPSL